MDLNIGQMDDGDVHRGSYRPEQLVLRLELFFSFSSELDLELERGSVPVPPSGGIFNLELFFGTRTVRTVFPIYAQADHILLC